MRKVVNLMNKKVDRVRNDLHHIEGYSIIMVDSIRSINYIGGNLNG